MVLRQQQIWARPKVLESLFTKTLITRDSTDWFVAAESYDALGHTRPTPANTHPEVEAAVSAAEALDMRAGFGAPHGPRASVVDPARTEP
jgi:hypothetical protein